MQNTLLNKIKYAKQIMSMIRQPRKSSVYLEELIGVHINI